MAEQGDFFKNEQKQRNESGSLTSLMPAEQGPLAFRARPRQLEHFAGKDELLQRYPWLQKKQIMSCVICGGPGRGKTTLAKILAQHLNLELYLFNAVMNGLPELKKLIQRALEAMALNPRRPAIFIDEIHRFNKAQQDALLPYLESGELIFFGATTENARTALNPALLSRLQIIELPELTKAQLLSILQRACQQFYPSLLIETHYLDWISEHCAGDARRALNFLEMLTEWIEGDQKKEWEQIKNLLLHSSRQFDATGDRHYDVISAFIKSLRGSDPQSALLWLAIMLDGGEDPVFIARRLVIFASEDVGNADPTALNLATAALSAVQQIGMPECRINLAQAVTYLASTYKSNASYLAIDAAMEFVRQRPNIAVPLHLRNQSPEKKNYRYPHQFPHHFVDQDYSGLTLPDFYCPTEEGKEKGLKQRLQQLWQK